MKIPEELINYFFESDVYLHIGNDTNFILDLNNTYRKYNVGKLKNMTISIDYIGQSMQHEDMTRIGIKDEYKEELEELYAMRNLL